MYTAAVINTCNPTSVSLPVLEPYTVLIAKRASLVSQQYNITSPEWSMQGCAKSQALRPGELQPPRLRQKTTAAVARRLIGNALSNSGVHDKVSLF